MDNFFRVTSLPSPGETLSAKSFMRGLGGKGANQSVALAKAGAQVVHVGAVGTDGIWMKQELAQHNVDVTQITELAHTASGQAIILVDDEGENAIVLDTGANGAITHDHLASALANAQKGEWLVLQNETNGNADAVKLARQKGMKIAYSAAPFDAQAVEELIDQIDLIAVNAVELEQLQNALPQFETRFSNCNLLVTLGANGARFVPAGQPGEVVEVPSFPVNVVDTTGAGDTFFGSFLAQWAQGDDVGGALTFASAAAALQVTQNGTSSAIAPRSEVLAFLADRS